MKQFRIIALLAGGHGLNDLLAGYFLGSFIYVEPDLLQVTLGLFIYNLLAFGGQYPVALWLEKYNHPKRFLLFAYVLNVAAAGSFLVAPHIAIVLAGIASAVYHVAGGTVCAKDNKAASIGLFAAPGVIGLIAGGYLAYEKIGIMPWLFIGCALFLGILYKTTIHYTKPLQQEASPVAGTKFSLDRHDLVMILLLTLISLRSVVWNIFQLFHEGNYEWLIAIAASAFIGKIAGGWLADRIGWRLYLFLSLVTATPLISFFKDEIVLFCIGIGLLQSGIPATTALLIRSVNGKTERGIGLSFGTAIIAGALILYIPGRGLFGSNAFIIGISLLMLVLLFLTRKKNDLPSYR